MTNTRFDGRVALVTGGTSGIGRAAALAFAREGAAVVIAGRHETAAHDVVNAIQGDGGRSAFVRADMSQRADIVAMVERAVKMYGRLDCAVNNAATGGPVGPRVAEVDDDAFDHVIAVNLKGVWRCMVEEIRQMLRQDPPGGAIVNVSSVNSLGAAPGGAIYSASKAGVLALTKAPVTGAISSAGRRRPRTRASSPPAPA